MNRAQAGTLIWATATTFSETTGMGQTRLRLLKLALRKGQYVEDLHLHTDI